ncbi:hypothetical protein NDU88_006652, partial [Pleurodeles waltl]
RPTNQLTVTISPRIHSGTGGGLLRQPRQLKVDPPQVPGRMSLLVPPHRPLVLGPAVQTLLRERIWGESLRWQWQMVESESRRNFSHCEEREDSPI